MSLSRTHKMGAITSKTTTISVDDTEIRTVKYDVRLENIKYVFGMLVGCGIIGSDTYNQYLNDIKKGHIYMCVWIGGLLYQFTGASPSTSPHGCIVIVEEVNDNMIGFFKNLNDLMEWITSVQNK